MLKDINMTSFNIAIINPNDYIPSVYSTEKIKDDIEDFIKIVKVADTTEMMKVVIKVINLTEKQTGHTTRCSESSSHIYDICHTIQDKHYTGKDANYVASRLAYGHLNIYGNCVIIKSKINTDGSCSTDNITIDDIVQILRRKFVHKGIMINTNDTINEITYMCNPAERLTPKEIENIKGFEYQFLNYVFGLYIFLHPPDTIINNNASLISNKHVVGPAMLTLRSIDGELVDIDENLYTQIITTIKDGGFSRNLELNESVEPIREKSGKQLISNFYTVLSSRYYKCSKKTEKSNKYIDLLKKISTDTPLNTITIHKLAQDSEHKKT